MKIRMKVKVSSGSRIYLPKEIVDISDVKGEEFIRKGFAVEEKAVEVKLPDKTAPEIGKAITKKKR